MAASRFLLAGGILFAIGRGSGTVRSKPRQWIPAAIVGTLLLTMGNGGVVWAEQRVDSGMCSILLGLTPIWLALFDWRFGTREVPRPPVVMGLVLGFIGIALLVTGKSSERGAVDPWGVAALLASSLAWSAGSIYSRKADLPKSQFLATGMEMLAGGAVLVVLATALGEPARLAASAIAARSIVATAYLAVFGSLVGFTAYIWLLNNTSTAIASTYSYVTPIVAIWLGTRFAGEQLTARAKVASALVVGGVLLIVTFKRPARAKAAAPILEPA